LVGRVSESIDFFACKKFDGAPFKTFAWNGQDLITEFGVFWFSKRDVTEEGVDGCQTGVSGSNTVISALLNILKERAEKVRGKIFQR